MNDSTTVTAEELWELMREHEDMAYRDVKKYLNGLDPWDSIFDLSCSQFVEGMLKYKNSGSRKDMTIDDIERELGYKIRIVPEGDSHE